MSWTNQSSSGGGGPWGPRGGGGDGGGGGGGGPWGRGGGARGPDLEELLRRGQDRVRDLFPGDMSGRGLILAAAVAILIWGSTGFYTVGPEEQGVELQFGRYNATTLPGLNYHLPYPIETVIKVPVLTVRREEIGFRSGSTDTRGGTVRNIDDESLMLTGDENIIDVNFVVQWAVKDAAEFAFYIRSPDETVKAVAESAMREVIGKTQIASALAEGREKVAQESQALLQSVLDEYKSEILITDLLLQRADPPPAVIDNYRDVQRARADLERAINEGQAYLNRVVPEANGQAAQIRQGGQAFKERVIAEADGTSRRFLSVYEQYRLAEDVTRKRIYIETLEGVFRNMNVVIIDQGAAGQSGVVPYLPLPALQSLPRPAANSEPRQ